MAGGGRDGESFCVCAEKAFDSKHCLSISTHVRQTHTHAPPRTEYRIQRQTMHRLWAMCNFNLYSYHHFITLSHTNLSAYNYPTNNGNRAQNNNVQHPQLGTNTSTKTSQTKKWWRKKYVHAYLMCTFFPRKRDARFVHVLHGCKHPRERRHAHTRNVNMLIT